MFTSISYAFEACTFCFVMWENFYELGNLPWLEMNTSSILNFDLILTFAKKCIVEK